MICERPYYHAVDPEDVCFSCDGKGYRRWFDPSNGWRHDPCEICDAVSTNGLFVVQVITGDGRRHELNFQTRNHAAAVRRAELRAMAILRTGGTSLGYPVVSVRVIFKGTERATPEEIVHTVAVIDADPVAA